MVLKDKRVVAALVVSGLLGLIGVLHVTGYLGILVRLFADPQYLVETARGYDGAAILFLYALQFTNILVAPLPGQAIGVAYGIMYGIYWGTVIGMIGTAIGSTIGILIAKRWGRPIIKSLIGEKRFERYEELTESADVYPFVVLMILPVFPDDVVNLMGGLTTIDTKRLIVWLVAARFPGMFTLIWFGDSVASADYVLSAVLGVVVGIVSIWVIWKWNWIMETITGDDPTAETSQ